MQTQTIFQAGNSEVVAIPKYLAKELNLKKGQKVIVEKAPDGEAIVIKKVNKTRTKTKAKVSSSTEFKKWLSNVIKEDSEILDELAVR
ncbi:hypothetical protein A2960_02790 [Candidatus Gottesmanbacteria bacterium RIFCSPLOWO2_01_FULL_39_12b]|uniref:SpoVT-AbrB domain-containing protein n=1 Tax=Candidatus Gottesmanbacteria bacterium RIFCSPLOWO2_01_FULL_39_12b TaxID=1798388 RepID=A0A1F6AQV8_9BACT|nr:MAG: hypothetical protein A2960_02790 [Candidatus Gottesmanbacteria bacterium RIFCSPLOWO2_01_FULL_39_12b]